MKSARMPKLITLIAQKGYTAVELAELLHCTVRSSRDMLQKLKADKSIYIQSYRRINVNGWAAVYRSGAGEDAPRPAPLTNRNRVKKFREKETLDERELRLARQRQLKRKVKRDPLTAAFFGDV